MTTLADALGGMARPLAAVVAEWRSGHRWRRRLARLAYPELARRLDALDAATEAKLGPP